MFLIIFVIQRVDRTHSLPDQVYDALPRPLHTNSFVEPQETSFLLLKSPKEDWKTRRLDMWF